MRPVNFPEANAIMRAPEGHESEVEALHAYAGNGFYISAWEPSEEELEQLKRTGRIYLFIIGTGHPPVALLTAENVIEAAAKLAKGCEDDGK